MMAISAIALFVICIAGLLFAAWYEGGQPLVDMVIHMQATNRLAATASVPFYYYFIWSFTYYALSFPVAIIILITFAKYFFKSQPNITMGFLRHLAAWVLIILIGMSIPSDEKMRYILPITPAIALSAAYLYCHPLANKFLIHLRNVVNTIAAAMPSLGFIAVLGCLLFAVSQKTSLALNYIFLFGLFFALMIITFFCRKIIADDDKRELTLFIIGTTAFVMIYIHIVQPLAVQFNRAKPFVTAVETFQQADQQLVFYRIGPDAEDIKFMVALDKPLQPLFLQTPEELTDFSSPAIFIARDTDFTALPPAVKRQTKILYQGRLGHQDCVVFIKPAV